MKFVVSAKALRGAVLAAAVRTGRPPPELAALAGLDGHTLTDPDARISHARLVTASNALMKRSNDPMLGLFAAGLVEAAVVEPVDNALFHAPTLGEMVESFLRYQRLFHTAAASSMRVDAKSWRVTLSLEPGAEPCPYLVDFVLASWVRRLRRAAGRDVPLRRAAFRRPEPPDPGPYEEIFGDSLRFGQADDSIEIAAEAAAFPVVTADARVRMLFEQEADAAVTKLDPDHSFLRSARAALELQLRDEAADVASLARALAMSTRTLQRRLLGCDTSFHALVDDVRRDLALRHLEKGHSVTDTAFLLGFSELSSFSRAFRRWTGKAPRSFRPPSGPAARGHPT